jgi:hypothetical protein
MQANQRVYRLAAVGRLLLTDCCSAMRDLPLSKRPERAILDSQPPGIGGMSDKARPLAESAKSNGEQGMALKLHAAVAASALLAAMFCTEAAIAQEQGGILKIHHRDSPPSLSILEEVTISTVLPMMGVFNNLVLYEQDEPQNSLKSIVPELASEWSWSEDGTRLTFRLREGVRWHDGRPFTSKDVQCTWDLLLGRSPEKLRTNPRKTWYHNLEEAEPLIPPGTRRSV